MMIKRTRRGVITLTLLAALSIAALSLYGCASSHPNRSSIGDRFPSVTGESLKGEEVRIPEDLAGAPAVLLVGYAQEAQFDADRWILGLIQGGVTTRLMELPTIDGLMPALFSGRIDEGMRRGIPNEDWASVVTVYGDADKIVAFTGNEVPNNIRVLLLDSKGKVTWHHDRGYSAGKLMELKAAIEALGSSR